MKPLISNKITLTQRQTLWTFATMCCSVTVNLSLTCHCKADIKAYIWLCNISQGRVKTPIRRCGQLWCRFAANLFRYLHAKSYPNKTWFYKVTAMQKIKIVQFLLPHCLAAKWQMCDKIPDVQKWLQTMSWQMTCPRPTAVPKCQHTCTCNRLLIAHVAVVSVQWSSTSGIPSVCMFVSLHDKTKTSENKIAKLGTGIVHHDTLPINEHKVKKGHRSRSQGHKVHNVATRQPCGTVSLRMCRPARLSRRARTVLLKTIKWSASVVHSLECPASCLI